jgi:hypothetical protein
MSQHPGPHGSEPNQPAPSRRPGPFPPPGCPQSGPPAQPPHKKNLFPWLIVGGALLIFGLGILLLVLFTQGDGSRSQPHGVVATSTSWSSPSSSLPASPDHEFASGVLPGGAQAAERTSTDQGVYAGSGEVARAWVQAMADGDFQTAYALSCGEVQEAATSAGADGDPAWHLATYFFEQTLGGEGFSEGTLDGVEYSPTSASDVASFTLVLDSGEKFLLQVYVDPDQSVCGFR